MGEFSSLERFGAVSSPDGMGRPAGLHRCRRWRRQAGAHQHGAVDVGCNHQDAEQDGPDDGALQPQIVRSARHRQTRQVRVSTAETRTPGDGSTHRNNLQYYLSQTHIVIWDLLMDPKQWNNVTFHCFLRNSKFSMSAVIEN